MSNLGLLESWRTRLSGYKPGEMSVMEWCLQEGISHHQFYYWRRRTSAAAAKVSAKRRSTSKSAQPWVAVELTEPSLAPVAAGGVSVRMGSALIELQRGFDPAMLRAVVTALETPQ